MFFCLRTVLTLHLSSLYLLSHHRTAVNYYDLLGVKSDASMEEIKNAFLHKSKKLHPDTDPSNPALHSQFVELSEAYRVLSKDLSRKEYDFKIRHPYSGILHALGKTANLKPPPLHTTAQNNMRYWEQFHRAQKMTAKQQQQKRKDNLRLVGYCIIALFCPLCFNLCFSNSFRKLKQVHNDYMDEKDRIITQIYNESKERARINGFKKQTEILRQKHAEFLEKYKIPSGVDK
uniref:J domain-containing protein n=1 Tax=Monopterus albus TaxID=43700 RepID=A0A3Q3JJ67_MONAL